MITNTRVMVTSRRTRPEPVASIRARLYLRCLPSLLLLAGAVTGCASAGEKAARTAWVHVAEGRADAHATMVTPAVREAELTSLPGILALAEATSPSLRASFDRWTAALEAVPRARSLPDPRLSYAFFVEPVETRVGPQRHKVGVAQTIPLFGKLGLRGDMAVHDASAAGARFTAERLALRERVARLWADYFHLGRALAVTEESLRLLTYFESVALRQYAAGDTPHAAVVRAQLELGRLEERIRSLRDRRRPLLAALNAELDRSPDAPIAWPDTVDDRPVAGSRDELVRALAEANPTLAAQRAEVARRVAAAKLASRRATPDLTIGAEYIDTGAARFPDVGDSGKDAAVAMASINLPLWLGRNRAERAEADARRTAAEADLVGLERRLVAELDRAHVELHDASRRVELHAYTLLPKARQALEVTEGAFTAGDADFQDLIDVQRTLLELELDHARALADQSTARAELERVVGRELAAE